LATHLQCLIIRSARKMVERHHVKTDPKAKQDMLFMIVDLLG
jgi:hypothetical protein